MDIISFDHADKKRLRDFVQVPLSLYRGDPHFIPQLCFERRMHLGAGNPYFRHAAHRFFVAYGVNGAPLGRISAQIDSLAPAGTGHFGFVDAADEATLGRLLRAAEDWLKQGGARTAQGPYSLSINDEAGLLADGFTTPPRMMMNYAPPWMTQAFDGFGYRKAKDLIAFIMRTDQIIPGSAARMAQKAGSQIAGISERPLEKKRISQDLGLILTLFNRAWAGNWGFVPMTGEEMSYTANNMMPLIDPALVRIAEINGRPAAMIVALPDLNEAISDLGGRLLPFGWAKLIARLKASGVRGARVLLMGVDPDFQGGATGGALALFLIARLHEALRARGYAEAELSWVLEDNTPTIRLIESVGGRAYKTYRIFERELA